MAGSKQPGQTAYRTAPRRNKSIAACLVIAATCLLPVESHAHFAPGLILRSRVQFAPYGFNGYTDIWGMDDFAIMGTIGSGVAIIDISDIEEPTLAATYPATGNRFVDVKEDNGIGFFASDNGGGVHVVDLTNPSDPTRLSEIGSATGGFDSVKNVFVQDGFLYEVNETSPTVKVFDIRTPATPRFTRDIVTTETAGLTDIFVDSSRLYVTGSGIDGSEDPEGSAYIYDVTDIGSQPATYLTKIPTGPNTQSISVSADGNHLVTTQHVTGGHTLVHDISDLANPTVASDSTASSLEINAFWPSQAKIVRDRVFIAYYEAGLQVVDLDQLDRWHPPGALRRGYFSTYHAPFGANGAWGVYPYLGSDRVLISDTIAGLFVINAYPVLPDPGDVYPDGQIDNLDIGPFILALEMDNDERTFQYIGPDFSFTAADVNLDGFVNNLDISPFLSGLIMQANNSMTTLPEPSTWGMFLLIGIGVMARRVFPYTR